MAVDWWFWLYNGDGRPEYCAAAVAAAALPNVYELLWLGVGQAPWML
jgi:hypothetical protein